MPALTIERAGEQDRDLLFRLAQLYYFEASSWSGEDILADGLYECDQAAMHAYCDAGAADHAFILRADGHPAGFALVERVPYGGAQIREFADLFVLPKYRRLGLAGAAARHIVTGSGEPCLFAVYRKDQAAQRYWRSAFGRLGFRSVREVEGDELFNLFIVEDS